jgi:hypothetical protein
VIRRSDEQHLLPSALLRQREHLKCLIVGVAAAFHRDDLGRDELPIRDPPPDHLRFAAEFAIELRARAAEHERRRLPEPCKFHGHDQPIGRWRKVHPGHFISRRFCAPAEHHDSIRLRGAFHGEADIRPFEPLHQQARESSAAKKENDRRDEQLNRREPPMPPKQVVTPDDDQAAPDEADRLEQEKEAG